MPNWCYNRMVVFGNSAEIKDFQQKCLSAMRKAEETGVWSLYAIYEEFGFEEKEILDNDSNGYIRGNIVYVDEVVSPYKNGQYCILIEYESAWSSMLEGFNYLFSKYYKSLRQYTVAEECGMEIYINTDTNHEYFDEKYVLWIEDDDTYYCKSDKEVIDIINDTINLNNAPLHTINECYKLIANSPINASLNEYSAY